MPIYQSTTLAQIAADNQDVKLEFGGTCSFYDDTNNVSQTIYQISLNSKLVKNTAGAPEESSVKDMSKQREIKSKL